MPRTKRHIARSIAYAGGFLAAASCSAWFWLEHDRLLTRQTELASTVLRLERLTGYVGFIHDFKNAVLRPAEPVYLQRAEDQFAAAMQTLDDLQQIAQSEALDSDLSAYRATLLKYHDHLVLLRETPFDSSNIADADALVRVRDSAARENLDALTAQLSRALADRAAPVQRNLMVSLAISLILLTLLVTDQVQNARIRAERDRLEARQQMLEAEQRHSEELAQSLDQLRQLNREQAEFTYSISHDLKSPTITARMLVAALQEDLSPRLMAQDQELLDDLDQVLGRMAMLTTDMQNYTQALNTEELREDVSLDDVLDGVIDDLRADIASAEVSIQRAPLPSLQASPHQMRNLLQNLLHNALKFARTDAPLKIAIGASDAKPGHVAFYIADTGIGIAENQHDAIFRPFARLHLREQFDGSGLGLPICLRIARAHGGGITVDSTEGAGSTFTVTLKAS
ncbi:signal transduction histidine kinase [Sagittula marina]|uniref:histidine kinase n=1 Tax=Sagittula marina TaxID=943940 RepID=A0A7W6GU51_9RHOB|nr:ATP-binding protein [Sagittula marina]MBB3988231.1 signal transduction histidine kinase [Sagittula marina]